MPAKSVIPSLLLLAAALFAPSGAHPHPDNAHHLENRALPGSWYHARDHPVNKLFKRGAQTDGITYATVGSPEWSAGFPPQGPIDTSTLPQAWVDAYNAAKSAGKIPNLAPSTQAVPYTNPTYPGQDPTKMPVCSATYKCRNDEDLWDAPDGVFGSSFDDGPLDTSMPLYELLHENNLVTTHFMIGINIIWYPQEFLYAFDTLGSDIAVHTWTHRYMTTLSDEELLGEFGFTMELIHNSTGGRIPKYWRPPYGDSDERVRAIAKEVFGLKTVIWNQDTEDWSIGEAGGATRPEVNANLEKWITGPKSPGLIILEHELSNDTTGAFIQAFPLIAQNGWKFESVARLDGGGVYLNAADSTAAVQEGAIAVYTTDGVDGSSGSASTGAAGSSSTSVSSGKNAAATSSSASTTTGSAQASTTTGAGAAGDSNTSGAAPSSRVSAVCVAGLSVLGAAFMLS